MAETLYATFSDPDLARKAAGALLDHGATDADLSLVSQETEGELEGEGSLESLGAVAVDAPVDEVSLDEVEGDLDPDLAETGAVADAAAEADEPLRFSGRGAVLDVDLDGAPGGDLDPAAESPADVMEVGEDEALVLDSHGVPHVWEAEDELETEATAGLTTTTAEDATAGAVKGAGVGLAVGAVVGLASLLVPGVGLVAGGGALAAALTGAALSTGAGAIAGGVTGYLKDQGVPAEVAETLEGAVTAGGALLTLSLPSGDLDRATAEDLLRKYGASEVAWHSAS